MIESQGYVQAQGGGFAPVQNQHIPTEYTGFKAKPFIDGVSSFAAKIIKPMQDNAFLEGVTDHAAGAIEERSWLTADSYNQGVNYSVFGGKLNEANSRITKLADESAKNGDTTEIFNQKIKGVMFDVNSELDKLGLEGDARKLAQKQILEVPITSLKAFEKRRQEEYVFNIQAGNASMVNTAMQNMHVAGYEPNAVIANLDTTFDTLVMQHRSIGSKNPFEDAGKDITGALDSRIGALNMADPQSRDVLNRISTAIGSEKFLSKFPPSTSSKLRDTVVSKQKEAMTAHGYELNDEMVNMKLAVDAGTLTVTGAQINALRDLDKQRVHTGVINIQEAERREQEYLSMYAKGATTSATTMNALYGTPSTRLLNSSDSDDAKVVGQQAAKMFPNQPTKIADFMINTGINTGNPVAIENGAKFLAKNFMPLMNLTAQELAADGAVAKEQADSFLKFAQMVKQNPGRSHLMMNAIDDPKQRSELLAYISQNPNAGANVGADIRKIQENIALVKTYSDGSGNIVLPSTAKVAPEDFQEGFLSKWWNGGASASGSVKASDRIAITRANTVNNIAQRNLSAIVQANNGVVPQSKIEMISAIQKSGRGLMLSDGLIEWDKNFENKLGVVGANGKRLSVSKEDIARTLDGMRTQHAANWKVPRESVDVMLEPYTGQIILYGVNEDGTTIQKRNVTERVVNENLQAEYNRNHKAASVAVTAKPVATMQKQGQAPFTMTQGWNETALGALGTKLAANMHAFEGFVVKPTNTRSAADQKNPNLKQVNVMGLGVSMEDHPKWAPLFKAAEGNPQKLSQLNAAFAKDYYNDFWPNAKSSGLTEGHIYRPEYQEPILGMAYAKWLGGTGGQRQYAQVLATARTDKQAAIKMLQGLAVYKQAGTKNGARDSLVQAVYNMPS